MVTVTGKIRAPPFFALIIAYYLCVYTTDKHMLIRSTFTITFVLFGDKQRNIMQILRLDFDYGLCKLLFQFW